MGIHCSFICEICHGKSCFKAEPESEESEAEARGEADKTGKGEYKEECVLQDQNNFFNKISV